VIKFASNFQDLSKNFKISTTFQKLASGARITKASDDPAGLSVAAGLSASISSLSAASQNISYAVSRVQIADSGLELASGIGSRLQELATQAANGTLSDDQRSAIQSEYTQLTAEIQRIASSTEFNGQKVLDGSALVTQVGTDSSANSQISSGGVNLSQLAANLTSQSLSSQAAATSAIDEIAKFSADVSNARSTLGASGSRFVTAQAVNEVAKENLAAARAQIVDVDIAETTANLVAQTILQNANTAISAQAGKLNSAVVLNLLGSGKK